MSCQTELSGEDLVQLEQLQECRCEVETLQQTVQEDSEKHTLTCEAMTKDILL